MYSFTYIFNQAQLQQTRQDQAFLLFDFLPPALLSAPVVSAAARASRVSESTFRKSDDAAVLLVEEEVGTAAARLGSAWAISGTVVASMIWKGSATKWPCASNHSAKDRVNSILLGCFSPLGVTSTATQYVGSFFFVEVEMEI